MSGSLADTLRDDYRRFRGRPCAAVKTAGRFAILTYEQVERRVARAALQLLDLGLALGDRVAIVSRSRLDWLVADQAVCAAGGVVVPVYPTLTPPVMGHVLRDSGTTVAIVEGATEADRVRQAGPEGLRVISFADAPGTDRWLGGEGDGALDLDEPRLAARRDQIQPSDLLSFLFTSGTTGVPKGVLYDHVRAVGSLATLVDSLGIRSDDVALTFLPMSHALGRGSTIAYFHAGVLDFFGESLDTVAEDFQLARPTVAFTVPRVFEKAHERIQAAVRAFPPRRQRAFAWALRAARDASSARQARRPVPAAARARLALADRIVLRRIRGRLGGRVRVLWSGGASLPASIAEFFAVIGIPIRDVYGMSEFGLSHVTPEGVVRFGSCGRPAPGYECRLAEDGEVLVRSHHGMLGYHGLPEDTARFRDADGWMHTGDVGRIDDEGYLYITDRKKSLLVLSNGKKVAPAPLEERLIAACPFVLQAVVVGEGRHHAAVLVHPDRDLQRARGLDEAALREAISRGLDLVNRDLPSFETLKRFAILEGPLTEADGDLTPTLKIRRAEVARRHAALIDGLYASGAGA